MITVHVMLNSAVTGKATELARMDIINDGRGTSALAHYDVRIYRGRTIAALNRRAVHATGKVKDHPRQSQHVWALVAKALAAARPKDLRQVARPEAEWHDDHRNVVWWKFPVDEPPFVGSPLGSDWPGYHTHWTPLPDIPIRRRAKKKAAGPKTGG